MKNNIVKIIFLNAPPKAGKDTSILHEMEEGNAIRMSFADELKHMTHRMYDRGNIPADHYENVKDTPHIDFFGMTPRQAYINLAERCIKPMHGKGFFGVLLAMELSKRLDKGELKDKTVIITDIGFNKELQAFWKTLKQMEIDCNAILVHIHKQGCNFHNDSRETVIHPKIPTLSITNDGSITELQDKISKVRKLIPYLPHKLILAYPKKSAAIYTFKHHHLIDSWINFDAVTDVFVTGDIPHWMPSENMYLSCSAYRLTLPKVNSHWILRTQTHNKSKLVRKVTRLTVNKFNYKASIVVAIILDPTTAVEQVVHTYLGEWYSSYKNITTTSKEH